MLVLFFCLSFFELYLLTRHCYAGKIDAAAQFALALTQQLFFSVLLSGLLLLTKAYSQNSLTLSFALLSVILFFVCLKLLRASTVVARPQRRHLFSWALLLSLGLVFLPPSHFYAGGVDPSLYVGVAANLWRSGSSDFVSEPLKLLAPEEAKDLLGFGQNGRRYTAEYNGVFVQNDGSGLLEFEMSRGPSYLLALAFALAGFHYGFGINSVVAALSCFLLYVFSSFFMKRRWAACAAVLLAISPVQQFFGKGTFSEPLSQLAFLALGIQLALYVRYQQQWSLFGAVLAVVAAVLFRIDQFSFLLTLLLFMPWLAKQENDRRWLIGSQVLLCGCCFFLQWHYAATSPVYYRRIAHEFFIVQQAPIISIFLTVLAWLGNSSFVRHVCFACSRRLRLFFRGRQPAQVVSFFRSFHWNIVLVLVFVAMVWGVFLRPSMWELDIFRHTGSPQYFPAGERTFSNLTFLRLGAVIGYPIFFAAFFGFVYFLRRHRHQPAMLVLLCILLQYAVVLLAVPFDIPRMYWTMRRFVPVLIPMFLFLGVWTLSRFIRWSPMIRTTFNFVVSWFIVSFVYFSLFRHHLPLAQSLFEFLARGDIFQDMPRVETRTLKFWSVLAFPLAMFAWESMRRRTSILVGLASLFGLWVIVQESQFVREYPGFFLVPVALAFSFYLCLRWSVRAHRYSFYLVLVAGLSILQLFHLSTFFFGHAIGDGGLRAAQVIPEYLPKNRKYLFLVDKKHAAQSYQLQIIGGLDVLQIPGVEEDQEQRRKASTYLKRFQDAGYTIVLLSAQERSPLFASIQASNGTPIMVGRSYDELEVTIDTYPRNLSRVYEELWLLPLL